MTNPEAIVEDLKSVEKFDLLSALSKVSYPTQDVTVYLDGAKAHELNLVLDDIGDLEHKAEGLSAAAQGSIVDDPEKEDVDALIEKLKVEEARLVKEIAASALTFSLRGLAPEQWRIIDKEARRKIKPATKSDDDLYEAQLERNKAVHIEIVAKGTVKITDANGNEDTNAVSVATAENLFNRLLETEWMKLQDGIQNLTFAHTLFQNVAMQDADFLSKPSADQDSQATSE